MLFAISEVFKVSIWVLEDISYQLTKYGSGMPVSSPDVLILELKNGLYITTGKLCNNVLKLMHFYEVLFVDYNAP